MRDTIAFIKLSTQRNETEKKTVSKQFQSSFETAYVYAFKIIKKCQINSNQFLKRTQNDVKMK